MPRRYIRQLKEPARELRRHMTAAEQALWARLRAKQIEGVQFYRQRPLGRFIVDFYAPSAKLVVEVDGGYHLGPKQATMDRARSCWLEGQEFRVLRFTNREVEIQLEEVVAKVAAAMAARESPL